MNNLLSPTRANTVAPGLPGRAAWPTSNRWAYSPPAENEGRNEERPAFATKIILVPLALSGSSEPALAIAQKLARESGARLVLLHVVQLSIAGEERGIQRQRLLHELCQNAEAQLQQWAVRMNDQITAEVLVCDGRPAEAIVATAKRLQVDTIVLRQHDYHRWLRWLHRNTARQVVRQAPCRICLISPAKVTATAELLKVDLVESTRQAA